MDADVAKAGWDVFLFGIPLIVFLVIAFFRLDENFTSRKQEHPSPDHAGPKFHEHTRSMRSDPDGRPWDDR
jgi:hypothetical protein